MSRGLETLPTNASVVHSIAFFSTWPAGSNIGLSEGLLAFYPPTCCNTAAAEPQEMLSPEGAQAFEMVLAAFHLF